MFLWKGFTDRISWTPVSWKTITKPVVDGGLGVQDITLQNATTMAHLVWHFNMDKDVWWTRLLSQKYLRNIFDLC